MATIYFAGAVFTTQEVLLYCVIAFVLFGVTAGLFSFLIGKLMARGKGKDPKFAKSIICGITAVAIFIITFIVIPTVIKDSRWERKQQTCAEKSGYSSPADDNSSIANFETQSKYRQCLGL